jgi:hypothetical protein
MTGIGERLTEESWRGAHAMAIAFLRDDYEGQDAITAHATPAELLGITAAAVALATGALHFTAAMRGEVDPDAFAERALAGSLRAALADCGGDITGG